MIPIGIGGKVPKTPFFTIAISIAICAAFFAQPSLDKLFESKKQVVKKYNLVALQQKMFLEFCLFKELEKDKCEKVSKFSSPLYSSLVEETPKEKFEDVLKTLKKENEETKKNSETDSKDKEGSVQEIKKIAFSKIVASKKGEVLFPYKQLLRKFLQDMGKGKYASYEQFPVFRRFFVNQRKYVQEIKTKYVAGHHFSTLTQGPVAAAHSVFRHANLMHIFGNLLIIVGVGRYVEMFLGPIFSLVLFLFGGMFGAYAFAQFSPVYEIVPLVGASGGASALLGFFLVLFRKKKLKFLVFPFPHELFIVSIPPTIILPVFLLAGDLSGINTDILQSGPVAYWAHLGGFFLGFAAAILYLFFKPINWPILYPFEKTDVENLLQEKQIDLKIKEGKRILEYNFDNIYVKVEMLCHLVSIPPTKESTEYLEKYLQTTLALCLQHGRKSWALMLLRYIPTTFPLSNYLDRLGQENTLKLANYAFEEKDYWVSVRMLNSFVSRFDQAFHADEVWKKSLGHLRLAHQDESQWNFILEMERAGELASFSSVVQDLNRLEEISVYGPTPSTANGSVAIAHPTNNENADGERSHDALNSEEDYHLKEIEDYHLYHNAVPNKRIMALAIDVMVQMALIELILNFVPSIIKAYVPYYHLICYGLVFILYTIVPTIKSGQTMGKKAYGIRVVPMKHSKQLQWYTVLARECLRILQLVYLPFLYIQVLYHKNFRSIYDLITDVKVIDYRDKEAVEADSKPEPNKENKDLASV